MNELTVGREPLTIVEIEQPCCSNRYGISPCLANGAKKCYNTISTCQSLDTYDQSASKTEKIVWRFCKPEAHILFAIPNVISVSSLPTKINIGGGSETESPFGRRGSVTIQFNDHPFDDYNDFYLADRGFNPLEKGTFWGKWLARNPYYSNFKVAIYEGYHGQEIADMQKRVYFIDKISRDASGKTTITAKDPLKWTDEKKALIPKVIKANLKSAITATQTTGIIVTSDSDMRVKPSNTSFYYIRVGDEFIRYSSATQAANGVDYTLASVARGTYGTTAEAHDADDAVSWVVFYGGAPHDIAYQILTNYTDIPSEYIDLDEWNEEGDTWLSTFNLSGSIAESTAVNEILGELCEQCQFYIWWDERAAKIKLKAVRPEIENVYTINDRVNIIKDSFSIKDEPNQRASRVAVYYIRRNHAEDIEKISNYKNISIRIDGDSEVAYGEVKTKRIYSRWINTDAEANFLAYRLLQRYRLNPRYVTIKVDAKDRNINVGDVVILDTNGIQDEFGDNEALMWQVISLNEIVQGETIQLEMQGFEFKEGERYGFYTYPDALNYNDYTPQERRGKAFYAGDDDTINGDLPYLYS